MQNSLYTTRGRELVKIVKKEGITQKKNNKKTSQEELVTSTFDKKAGEYASWYSDSSSTAHSFNIRRKKVYDLIDRGNLKNINRKKVLDVGCGPGIMVKHLVEHGYEFFGVDIAREMIEECEKTYGYIDKTHFSVGRIEKLEFPDSFFDLVICMGVVEYLDNDALAIKEIIRVTKPNGTLVITLPNKKSPLRILNRVLIRKIKRLGKILVGRGKEKEIIHKEYNEREYRNLLKSSGLILEDIVYYNFKLIPFPFDKIFQRLTVFLTRKLEFLGRSSLRWLGTGFIVKVRVVKD